MDPKPTIDPATLSQVSDLKLVDQRAGFPFPASSPILCAPMDGRLHAVSLDVSEYKARHVAFDGPGQAVGAVETLPLMYVMGMASCAEELVVVGANPGNNCPIAL